MRESDVVKYLLARDERGVSELVKHYGPLMRYIIAPILSDERDREEALSMVTMRVWEKIMTFDAEKGSFAAWLTALCRNTALNFARGQRKDISLDTLSEEEACPEPTPEENVLISERKQALRLALMTLSQKERTLFYRKYYYRQSTSQIAAELGMTARAVEGKLYRIKRKLRDCLGGDMNERP